MFCRKETLFRAFTVCSTYVWVFVDDWFRCCSVEWYRLWPGLYGSREVELVGGGKQKEQHVPFSKEVEREIVGSISGRLSTAFSAAIIHFCITSALLRKLIFLKIFSLNVLTG